MPEILLLIIICIAIGFLFVGLLSYFLIDSESDLPEGFKLSQVAIYFKCLLVEMNSSRYFPALLTAVAILGNIILLGFVDTAIWALLTVPLVVYWLRSRKKCYAEVEYSDIRLHMGTVLVVIDLCLILLVYIQYAWSQSVGTIIETTWLYKAAVGALIAGIIFVLSLKRHLNTIPAKVISTIVILPSVIVILSCLNFLLSAAPIERFSFKIQTCNKKELIPNSARICRAFRQQISQPKHDHQYTVEIFNGPLGAKWIKIY